MTSYTLRHFGLLALLVLPVAYGNNDCILTTSDPPLEVSFTAITGGHVDAEVELQRWERCAENGDDELRLLVMPGYGHNANTTEALAIEVLLEQDDVGEVAAINTPGKGGAPLPLPPPLEVAGSYGNMTQQNLADIFIQVLEAYAEESDVPVTLLGHSQGAGVIMASEQLLMEAGGGLNADYGIEDVAFLAPAVPEVAPGEDPIPWEFDPLIFDLIEKLRVDDEHMLGSYLAPLPAAAWQQLFFSTLAGTLDPNVPAIETIAYNAYNTPEPLLSTLQLVNLSPPEFELERVAISKKLFKKSNSGIKLTVMCGKQDTLLPLKTCKAVKKYLGAAKFVKLKDGVHDAYITIPEEVVKRLKLGK